MLCLDTAKEKVDGEKLNKENMLKKRNKHD